MEIDWTLAFGRGRKLVIMVSRTREDCEAVWYRYTRSVGVRCVRKAPACICVYVCVWDKFVLDAYVLSELSPLMWGLIRRVRIIGVCKRVCATLSIIASGLRPVLIW